MKLLRFLERRLAEVPSKSTLHKWVRSGQVRINGGRVKPFNQLSAGDAVRVPPFARARFLDEQPATDAALARLLELPCQKAPSSPAVETKLNIIDDSGEIMVLAKPGGLPCQPGSGHEDSVSARLAAAFAHSAFIPAPAHRLDRRTSGLVLAGRSHAVQQWLHDLLRTGGVRKEYLAWVKGNWHYEQPCLLEDTLGVARNANGGEKIIALPGGTITELRQTPGQVLPPLLPHTHGIALSFAVPVQQVFAQKQADAAGSFDNKEAIRTLLLVLLITGRKHQIRVQLASRGFPVIGDGRYGGPASRNLFLHAYAVGLPAMPTSGNAPALPPREYCLMPDWPADFLPDEPRLQEARRKWDFLQQHSRRES